jgi:serine/threonine-protein kinase
VESGHLLYVADGQLWAVRFDLETLQVSGEPVAMVDAVRVGLTGVAYYAVSRSGTLIYVTAGSQPRRSLMWVDRRGAQEEIKVPPRAYMRARLSPDGTRVALDIGDQETDIWIVNLTGDRTPRRLTYGPSFEINPVWIDNNTLVYSSNRSGQFALYSQAADGSGTAKQLTESGGAKFATTVALQTGVVGHQDGPTAYDVALFPTPQSGQPPPAQILVKTPSFEFNADLSPNGRYLAYQSNESGPFHIIVRPFPRLDEGRWTISTGGGSSPIWSRDGKELFYHDEADRMVAVPVDTSGLTFTWGSARTLFDIKAATTVPERSSDVSLDGQRFLFVKEETSAQTPEIVVVLDWLEELKARVPSAAGR